MTRGAAEDRSSVNLTEGWPFLSKRSVDRLRLTEAAASPSLGVFGCVMGYPQVNQFAILELESGTSIDGTVTALAHGRVVLGLPDLSTAPAELVVGAAGVLWFSDGLGRYCVKVSVARVLDDRACITAVVTLASTVETMQTRRYFRVPAKLPLIFSVLSAKDDAIACAKNVAAVTSDISAGGLRMTTSLALSVGDRIEVSLAFEAPPSSSRERPPSTIELEANVLRVTRGEARRGAPFVVGVDFLYRTERDRDNIVRLLFDLQRRTRAAAR